MAIASSLRLRTGATRLRRASDLRTSPTCATCNTLARPRHCVPTRTADRPSQSLHGRMVAHDASKHRHRRNGASDSALLARSSRSCRRCWFRRARYFLAHPAYGAVRPRAHRAGRRARGMSCAWMMCVPVELISSFGLRRSATVSKLKARASCIRC